MKPKVNGVYKEPSGQWVKINGVWKQIASISTKVNGVWKNENIGLPLFNNGDTCNTTTGGYYIAAESGTGDKKFAIENNLMKVGGINHNMRIETTNAIDLTDYSKATVVLEGNEANYSDTWLSMGFITTSGTVGIEKLLKGPVATNITLDIDISNLNAAYRFYVWEGSSIGFWSILSMRSCFLIK